MPKYELILQKKFTESGYNLRKGIELLNEKNVKYVQNKLYM
jgi:hypothetical protein